MGDHQGGMTGDHKDFWRWLSDELTRDAHQSRASGGLLPPRPVSLSEVEALGLLLFLLVCATQQCLPGDGLAAAAARRLVHTLDDHLNHVGTGTGVDGGW